jgi:hypothetical protein
VPELATEALVEHLGSGAAERLGLVHSDVGLVQKDFGAAPTAHGERHADARGHVVAGTVAVAPAQLGHEASADLDGVAPARHVRGEHHELVTADAGDGVHRAENGTQPARGLLQHHVARGVTLGVVDLLEVVEVDEEDRRVRARAGGLGERLVDAVDEQRPVRQPGEVIVGGLLHELGWTSWRSAILAAWAPLSQAISRSWAFWAVRSVNVKHVRSLPSTSRGELPTSTGTSPPWRSTSTSSMVVPRPSGPRNAPMSIGSPLAGIDVSGVPTSPSTGRDSISARRRLT